MIGIPGGQRNEILFADDDGAMRDMVADVLRSAGYPVRLVDDGMTALAEIRRAPPDLVILDYHMGEPNGFDVCRALKEDARLAHLPVIILTGQGEVDRRVQGFEAGADDYLPKPFDTRELVARVNALLRIARQGMERNPTTGLPGGDAVMREFERRRGVGAPFCVCYLDLDHFKPFNDRFGFAVADNTIRAAGAALAAVAGRLGAFAGHVGGDDFIAICAREQAHQLAAAVQAELHERLHAHLPSYVLKSGYYTSEDRTGTVREFPITRFSTAILRIEPGSTLSVAAFSEIMADAKHRAKREASGIAEATFPPAGEPRPF